MRKFPEHFTQIVDRKKEELTFKIFGSEFGFKISGGHMYVNFNDIADFVGVDKDYYFEKNDNGGFQKYSFVSFIDDYKRLKFPSYHPILESLYISTGTLLRFLTDIMNASQHFKESPKNHNKVGISNRAFGLYELFK